MRIGLALFLALTGCGKIPPAVTFVGPAQQALVAGEKVLPTSPQAKWAVLLRISSSQKSWRGTERSSQICTGVLIAPQVVLTVAHCFKNAVDSEVVFSVDDKDPTAVSVPVARVWSHPDYKASGSTFVANGQLQSDIALLLLQEEAPASYPVFKLASSTPSGSANVFLLGYGQVLSYLRAPLGSDDPLQGLGRLRMGIVEIEEFPSQKNHFSFGIGKRISSCSGDSGGPAFVEEQGEARILGLSKAGRPASPDEICGAESLYLNVTVYRQWIQDSLKVLLP